MRQSESKALALVAVSKIESASANKTLKRNHVIESLLSDDEVERLILNIIEGRPGVCPEKDIATMIQAATTVRYLSTCLELALKGLVTIDVDMTMPEGDIDQLRFTKRESISAALQALLKAQKA